MCHQIVYILPTSKIVKQLQQILQPYDEDFMQINKKSTGHDEFYWVGTDVWLKREPFLLVVKDRIVQHRAS